MMSNRQNTPQYEVTFRVNLVKPMFGTSEKSKKSKIKKLPGRESAKRIEKITVSATGRAVAIAKAKRLHPHLSVAVFEGVTLVS